MYLSAYHSLLFVNRGFCVYIPFSMYRGFEIFLCSYF